MSAEAKMKHSIRSLLENCPLLVGFSGKELDEILPLLELDSCFYPKGETMIRCGEAARLGIVTKGVLSSQRQEPGQSVHIVEMLEEGDLFNLEAVFSRARTSPTDLVADEDSSVLFFDADWSLYIENESLRVRWLEHVSSLLSNRCIRLIYKTEVLSIKQLRDQIMTYFRIMQRKHKSDTFQLKMNRQQFAKYLCVNRSALSRELGRMQREGLIVLEKNRRITVLDNNGGKLYYQKTPMDQEIQKHT